MQIIGFILMQSQADNAAEFKNTSSSLCPTQHEAEGPRLTVFRSKPFAAMFSIVSGGL